MQEHQISLIKEKVKKLLPKLKCAFHENQTLTNFCSCPKCLLPLCPTCIKIHTIQHVNMKTDPQYQNLFDVILNLNMQVKDFLSVYEDNHRHLTEVQQKLLQFKEQVFCNIQNLKRSIVDEVQKFFTKMLLQTEQKITQMKYIQDLDKHKSELKKAILQLKKFQKNLQDENVTGKFVIRNLIKYSSKNTDQALEKFDLHCKNFLSKVNGNFCTFSLKQNLKNSLNDYLSQIFKITINSIPTFQDKELEEILTISKKLQQFTTQNKGSQKNEIKNTLTKVMSKINDTFLTSSNKNLNSSQSHLNNTVSYQKKDKSKETKVEKSSVSKRIFDSNNKRSFTNHSSQRKSMNISRSFCQNDQSLTEINMSQNNNQSFQGNSNQRRSVSKGKGLSLIQPRYSIVEQQPKSLKGTQQIRFSLAQIQNVNFDLDMAKVSFINKRK